ncbi:MAG: sigma-70 family RNA polymerase sigma factor [Phycisphaerales bacterium]|jgi:RNA polymerase sigma-70 factor (ECF subfamily)
MTDGTTSAERIAAEAGLLARLRAGEDAAFAELVRTHSGRMLVVARRIVGSETDAEDVVQEAFVSAFKNMAKFDGRSTLGTWLHRIAVNAALMKRRRARSRPETSIDAMLPQFDNGFHKERPEPFESVTNTPGGGILDRETILAALDELPDEFREVVVLRDIEGLDSKAAGESLGIRDSLVRQRLHRARQALMKLLEQRMKGSQS